MTSPLLVRKAWTVTLNLSLVIYTMGTTPFVESLPGTILTQVAHCCHLSPRNVEELRGSLCAFPGGCGAPRK